MEYWSVKGASVVLDWYRNGSQSASHFARQIPGMAQVTLFGVCYSGIGGLWGQSGRIQWKTIKCWGI